MPESEEMPDASGVPGTECPANSRWTSKQPGGLFLRNSWTRNTLPNGKVLRKKIVFLKLGTWSKRKIQRMSEALDSCFSLSKQCFWFPESVEQFTHSEFSTSQWVQSARGGNAVVTSALCLQLQFQVCFSPGPWGTSGLTATPSWPDRRTGND